MHHQMTVYKILCWVIWYIIKGQCIIHRITSLFVAGFATLVPIFFSICTIHSELKDILKVHKYELAEVDNTLVAYGRVRHLLVSKMLFVRQMQFECKHARGYKTRTRTKCSTLLHTATHYNTLQHIATRIVTHTSAHGNTVQHAATYFNANCNAHCNTLQHTVTHCNTLQHTPHAATHCITLQHMAAHCRAWKMTTCAL